MAKQMTHVKANLLMVFNEGTKNFESMVELIFLTIRPDYKLTGADLKGEVKKDFALEETRINFSAAGIKELIRQLQAMEQNLESTDELIKKVNVVVHEQAPPQEK